MNQNTENMSLKEALVYIKALKDENERLKKQNARVFGIFAKEKQEIFHPCFK